MPEDNIRVLLIDDEPMALAESRQKLLAHVKEDNLFTAVNSVETLRLLQSVPIDLAFVDVEMPDTDGFVIADCIRETQPRAKYVFLTGHTELGAKSYDYEPLDFLCKPVDAARLRKTFERYARVSAQTGGQQKQIAVDTPDGCVLLRPSEITSVTREGRKTVIYCAGDRHIVRSTLDELELILADFDIVRCHQSYLVPLGKIRSLMQSEFGRAFYAVMENGGRIPVSRSRFPVMKEELKRLGTRFL